MPCELSSNQTRFSSRIVGRGMVVIVQTSEFSMSWRVWKGKKIENLKRDLERKSYQIRASFDTRSVFFSSLQLLSNPLYQRLALPHSSILLVKFPSRSRFVAVATCFVVVMNCSMVVATRYVAVMTRSVVVRTRSLAIAALCRRALSLV